MFDEVAALQARGHTVAHFSTSHPMNESSPFESHFAPYVELGGKEHVGVLDSLRAVVRMFRNAPAARCFEGLLEEFGPDIVHVHGIHRQLSPSILQVARRAGVPVVQTLHDFHHICPADSLLRGGDTPCLPPACGRLNYTPAISNACLGGSRVRSGLSAAETWYQRVRGVYEKTVDRFVAPSHFMADLMASGGWSLPIDIVPNAVSVSDSGRHVSEHDPYILYAGRLAAGKGVDVALKAVSSVGMRIFVVGDGPLAEELRQRFSTAEFLGHCSSERVEELLRGAYVSVMPSQLLENASMSVLEAMAHGVPVVATRTGGTPELIRDGVEGILCNPGDVRQMADALARLRDDPDLAARMGEAGRKRIAEEFSPDRHMDLLLASYERALSRS